MEGELIVDLRRVAVGKLTRRCRNEITDPVVNVACFSGDTTCAKCIDRRVGKQLDAIAVNNANAHVTDDAADLFIRNRNARDLEVERVTNPRDRRELEQQSDLTLVRSLEDRSLRIEPEQLRCPAEVRLENLTDVHTARHPERIEHDVDRASVGKERHILLGNDAGNDTLVAVASGHLVADRDLALLGHVNLDELNDARRELVGLQNAIDALFRLLLQLRLLVVREIDDRANTLVHFLVFDAERLEVEARDLEVSEHLTRELGTGRNRFLDRSRLERQRY